MGFDIFHENGIKYLLSDLSAKHKLSYSFFANLLYIRKCLVRYFFSKSCKVVLSKEKQNLLLYGGISLIGWIALLTVVINAYVFL